MLGQVERAIVDVFPNGGGVDYRAFERYHALAEGGTQRKFRAPSDSQHVLR